MFIVIPNDKEAVLAVLQHADKRTLLLLAREIENPTRHALDNMIFDVLGLTQGERDAVYEAVIALVEARLKQADSLNHTEKAPAI